MNWWPGERRLRAAKAAELRTVPAVVQDYADERILEIALIENIQREDLNPIETAQALERLAARCTSATKRSAATGKDRTTITNFYVCCGCLTTSNCWWPNTGSPWATPGRSLGSQYRNCRRSSPRKRRSARIFRPASGKHGSNEATRERAAEPKPPSGTSSQDPNVTRSRRDLRARSARECGLSKDRPDEDNRNRVLLAGRFKSDLRSDDRSTRREGWCRRQELNLRPTDYETVALTT